MVSLILQICPSVFGSPMLRERERGLIITLLKLATLKSAFDSCNFDSRYINLLFA